jgi:hypothetical protein
MVTAAEPHYALGVRAFALVDLGDSEAIDLFLREEDAQAALKDALRMSPIGQACCAFEPVELDERNVSAN